MFSTQFGRIALISVDGDPTAEIGQEEAGGQNVYIRQIGQTLAQQGWQVDMFTRRTRACYALLGLARVGVWKEKHTQQMSAMRSGHLWLLT